MSRALIFPNPGVCGIEHRASSIGGASRTSAVVAGTEDDRGVTHAIGQFLELGAPFRGARYGVPFVNPVSSHRSARAGTPIASSAR